MATRGASARRYAEAVFELAAENDTLDQWSADLAVLADFTSEPDVAALLSSNRVPREEKQKLLAAGTAGISPLAANLVRILGDRDKAHLGRDVFIAFQEMANERRGIAHATVTTAVPLSDSERDAIAKRLSEMTGKQVDVTAVVDESIIGGVIARIGDQLIDGSTRTRLVALKRRLAAAG